MKYALALVIGIQVLAACGNVASKKSFSTEQRIKISENELVRVGVVFKEDNQLNTCLSLHKKTCQNRVRLLSAFINEMVNSYEAEENMPEAYQQRTKNSVICVDLLNANLKDESSPNCQH